MLEELVDSYLSSLADAARVRYVNYLHKMPCRTATIGTACSGTDAPLLALLAIQHVVCRKYKLPVRFLHLFSAELDKRKRTFLQRMYPRQIKCLFGDCTTLHDMTSYDYISKRRVLVPEVQWMFMGFQCKDVSTLNPKQVELRQAFENDMTLATKTGKVFKDGVIAYAREHGRRRPCQDHGW